MLIGITKDKKHKSSIRKAEYKYSSKRNSQDKKITRIDWIEHLLQTSIEDYRKDCLWRIVGPYLLNVRNLSKLEASKIMENWLGNCDRVRKLDFEPRLKIYSIIKGNKGFKPISYSKLKEENRDLYLLIEKKTALQK